MIFRSFSLLYPLMLSLRDSLIFHVWRGKRSQQRDDLKKAYVKIKSLNMSKWIWRGTLTSLFLSLGGCVEGPPYYYAEKIVDRSFTPLNEHVGIYPDISVLNDPQNPFKGHAIGTQTRWQIEADGDPVAGFYCWATLLASIPTGEHQFYTALNLKAIFELERTSEEDLEKVRSLAIRAFQTVLDEFPQSVTYDRTGKIPYGLATLAYRSILDLEGVPQGGWTLVSTPEGGEVAIKPLDVPPPIDEENE